MAEDTAAATVAAAPAAVAEAEGEVGNDEAKEEDGVVGSSSSGAYRPRQSPRRGRSRFGGTSRRPSAQQRYASAEEASAAFLAAEEARRSAADARAFAAAQKARITAAAARLAAAPTAATERAAAEDDSSGEEEGGTAAVCATPEAAEATADDDDDDDNDDCFVEGNVVPPSDAVGAAGRSVRRNFEPTADESVAFERKSHRIEAWGGSVGKDSCAAAKARARAGAATTLMIDSPAAATDRRTARVPQAMTHAVAQQRAAHMKQHARLCYSTFPSGTSHCASVQTRIDSCGKRDGTLPEEPAPVAVRNGAASAHPEPQDQGSDAESSKAAKKEAMEEAAAAAAAAPAPTAAAEGDDSAAAGTSADDAERSAEAALDAMPAPAPAAPVPMPSHCQICGKGRETGQAMCHFEPTPSDPDPITLHVFCGKTACVLPKVHLPQYEILTKEGIRNKHGFGPDVADALKQSRAAVVPAGGDGARPEKAKFYLVREFEGRLRKIRAQASAAAEKNERRWRPIRARMAEVVAAGYNSSAAAAAAAAAAAEDPSVLSAIESSFFAGFDHPRSQKRRRWYVRVNCAEGILAAKQALLNKRMKRARQCHDGK